MEPGDREPLGAWLRGLRQAAGLSQEELAARSGISSRAIGNLERGTRRPYPRSVRLVATALGLSSAVSDELIATYRRMSAGPGPPDGANGPPDPPIAAPSDPAAVAPRQLPAAIRHFAGRAAELASLDRWLEQIAGGAMVISAINGMAGVGKTALALHWAHRVAGAFPDGHIYVNLRGYDASGHPADSGEVVGKLLDAIGVTQARIPVDLESRTALYRSVMASKRMLILADNAKDPAQVRPLLPGSPGSMVVVTSRNQLDGLVAAEGARTLKLDVLTRADAVDLLAAHLGADHVAAEPDAADELIALCAQLPLALAVVAARAAATNWPLAVHALELRKGRHRLDALSLSDAAADVRSVFSWSYRQLGDLAARMFRLLGIHPGPEISVPAAASLAALPAAQARAALRELSQANLIAERSLGRFVLHDLLHAYATDLALAGDAGEARQASTRMLDHYLHTAQAAACALDAAQDAVASGPAAPDVRPEPITDCDQALTWFDAEHKVLTAVVGQAARTGFDDHAQRLTWTMVTFCDRRGLWHDLAACQQIALESGRRLGDERGQVQTHLNLGRVYNRLGQTDLARANLERAVELADSIGDDAGQARAHISLSVVHESTGNRRESLNSSLRALELAQSAGLSALAAMACNNVGYNHAKLGDYNQALRYCLLALEDQRKAGSSASLEASAWDSLGYVYHELGDYALATDSYQRAIALFGELGASYLLAKTLDQLGDTYQAAGDAQAALDTWKQAVAVLEDLAHPDAGQVRRKLL